MTKVIDPNFKFYVTTLMPAIWQMLKSHLLNHQFSKVISQPYYVDDHGGRKLKYFTESIGYSKHYTFRTAKDVRVSTDVTLPPLFTKNWYMKRYENDANRIIIA